MLERFYPVADTDPEQILKMHNLLLEAHGAELPSDATPGQARKKLVTEGNEGEYYVGSAYDQDIAVMALYFHHNKVSHVEALAVDPNLRSRHLGSRALQELIELSRDDGSSLMRVVSLPRSVRFYENAGFRVVGDDPEHIDMIKKL